MSEKLKLADRIQYVNPDGVGIDQLLGDHDSIVKACDDPDCASECSWVTAKGWHLGPYPENIAIKISQQGCAECASLRARLQAAESECLEQARLNGMGAEREAKLMAENERLRKALGRYVPCRDCRLIGYGQCGDCKMTMAIVSTAQPTEDKSND